MEWEKKNYEVHKKVTIVIYLLKVLMRHKISNTVNTARRLKKYGTSENLRNRLLIRSANGQCLSHTKTG